ncbi:hypothetical protein K3163_07135 [Qipengyuania sp. 1NDW9]|uniref:Uncharacterized protein n=1 Tax=Qipengyuania xiapuensis TaxID=2867236 RepID=A0ABX8ZYN9_9SPHN|nr:MULTISPECIES: hypothetical protein [Qipengyuania]MBX7492978.1 hypothetical protein [Qipengyuania xiapuensis]QZD93886.1 hypothetical protein K3162_02130 [Qipengyuania xiapuensis]UOR14969.1 hypothetical protein LCM05_10840 [Qipengyuania aquimaris]
MKTLYLAGAALAFAAVPAAADHHAQAEATTETQAEVSTETPAPRFVRSEVTQTTPAGYAAASDGELPVCNEGQQDGCINSWEANKTGTRPLEYWPGRPASEIDEPLPATQAEFESMQKVEDDADSADPE